MNYFYLLTTTMSHSYLLYLPTMTTGGVVQETMRGPLGELFEESHTVTDVSGAGNNWAHGHLEYGPRHAEAVRRRTREKYILA